MSEKNHNFGDLVCIYAQLLPKIKESAKGLGYALAIHGSMNRDLDILAAPWIEDAAPPEALVAAIAEAVDGFVIGAKDGQFERGKLDPVPHKFPHGRMCWNICWGGRPFIDLSIMPQITKDSELYSKEVNEFVLAFTERATLRAEVEQAKRMNSELRKDVRTRDSHIEELEAENATLRAERDAALDENARLRSNLAITEKHYAELADFVERTPTEEQARELVRLQKALRKEMKS